MEHFVFKTENDVIEAAVRFMEARARYHTEALTSPDATKRLLRLRTGDKEREVFSVLFLDAQHRLLAAEDLFTGTLDGAAVYPREVLKQALAHNSAAVILAHNHPSGTVTPSTADRRITQRLKDALALVDIRVLDHVIVAPDASFSFAEAGLL